MAQMFYLSEPPALAHHVYVGGTHDGAGALHLLRMDAATGELRRAAGPPAAVLKGGGPWFALSPSGSSLYVSIRNGEGSVNNYCEAYAIAGDTGALTLLNQASTVLDGSAHCSVSPDGRSLVASMMSGGGAASFAIHPTDGSLEGGAAASVVEFPGGGSFSRMIRPGEPEGLSWSGYLLQDKCMAHSAQMTMDGEHVVCPDIGADKLWIFDLLPVSVHAILTAGYNSDFRCVACVRVGASLRPPLNITDSLTDQVRGISPHTPTAGISTSSARSPARSRHSAGTQMEQIRT